MKRPSLWRGRGDIGPLSETKRQIFELMQADGLYAATTIWSDTNIHDLVSYLRRGVSPDDVIARNRRRDVKVQFGVISVSRWERMSLAEKSAIIYQMWQIPRAAESLSAAHRVIKLLLSWGCAIEWMPALDEDERAKRCHYCVIDTEHSKISLKPGVGYGPSLSESLCCASLRCVGLLAWR